MTGMKKMVETVCVMSKAKGFAMQDGQLYGQTNTTDYIDLYVTHMDLWVSSHHKSQQQTRFIGGAEVYSFSHLCGLE